MSLNKNNVFEECLVELSQYHHPKAELSVKYISERLDTSAESYLSDLEFELIKVRNREYSDTNILKLAKGITK